MRKVLEKKLDVKVMIHFALGRPASLHVCGMLVLKIAIQGHADIGGSEKGIEREGKRRKGLGERSGEEDESQREAIGDGEERERW